MNLNWHFEAVPNLVTLVSTGRAALRGIINQIVHEKFTELVVIRLLILVDKAYIVLR